jgi:FkbM family methyltransferase
MTPDVLQRSAARDLVRLRLRQVMRWGDPYRYRPWRATVAGTKIETYNLDTLRYLVEEIFVAGCYEMGELPPAPHILDIGANIGLATTYFRRRYPDAHIVAVEADPESFALLQRNVAHHAVLHNVAVGSDAGEVQIYRRAGKPGRLTASLDAELGGDSGALITATPLSALITGRVDLLKMDIEGAEHRTLADLAATGHFAQIDRIVVELHRSPRDPRRVEETLDLLRGHGYTCAVKVPAQSDPSNPPDTVVVRALKSELG